MTTKSPIATITQNKLVDGIYDRVWVSNDRVGMDFLGVETQADLGAAIETLIFIRDAKVLK